MPDAGVRQLKAILAAKIIKTLDKQGRSARKAQSLTGIDAGDFSRVRNADVRRISIDRLMTMINGLGSRVEVAVKLRRADTRRAAAALWSMNELTLHAARRIAENFRYVDAIDALRPRPRVVRLSAFDGPLPGTRASQARPQQATG